MTSWMWNGWTGSIVGALALAACSGAATQGEPAASSLAGASAADCGLGRVCTGGAGTAAAAAGRAGAGLPAAMSGGRLSAAGAAASGRAASAGTAAAAGNPGVVGTAGAAATSGQAGSGSTTQTPGACDPGTTDTVWATNCPTAPPAQCTSAPWQAGGPDPDHANYRLLSESEHFAVYSDENPAGAEAAVEHLELVWRTYFGSPMYMKEPLCDATTKYKVSLHVHSSFGLTGGSWAANRMGMWIGSGGLMDHWGLAHEFAHGVQAVAGGLRCNGGSANYCGWIHESHANFMAHQLAEYRANEHCSEMLFNVPHLYLGSTRDRYCNWQFMEFLKDKHCFAAVNAIWTSPTPADDPFTNIMKHQGWSIGQANDFYGEWAMHNISWDYKDPEPIVSGKGGDTDPAAAFLASYGPITDTSKSERRLRVTRLEPLDESYASHRRFMSPYHWAPQRYGYNVVRLVPEAGAQSVSVTFRGVTQDGADSDWRWGLVSTSADMKTTRYSALQRGADGQLELCVQAGEQLWLVVMGTPSRQQQIKWDQAYTSIYRYPYMVELKGAWPEGFEGGAAAACPSGTVRVANGGGCGPANLPASVYVGPYATVLGGTVSGNARIEDHAQVINGTVSGGTVGALSIIGSKSPPYNANTFNVGGSATAKTTFYPLGFFEAGQSLAGDATLYGDVELRGPNFSLSRGAYSGIVSSTENTAVGPEVTTPPPYTWRQ